MAVLGAGALAIAAVLTGDALVLAETSSPAVLRRVALPGPAAALFAAPDGRVLLPLAGSDETVVVSASGAAERWPGRVFPVFFDEIDRMHVLFPELLLVMSYPERLPLLRVPIAGLPAPWRAASSANGLLVVACAPPAERRLVLVVAEPGVLQRPVALAGEPRSVVMSPAGDWVGVGLDDGVEVVFNGEPRGRGRVPLAGGVRALAAAADGRELLVGTGGGERGALLALRISPKLEAGAKLRREVELPGPVAALAVAASEVVAVAGERLVVLAKGGRKVTGELPLAGASQVVLLPARPESAAPLWSEPPSP